MTKQARSLAEVDTDYSADCIEWCPFAGFQDLFICGTYQVLEPLAAEVKEDEPATATTTSKGDSDDDDEVDMSDAPKRQTQRTGRLLLFQVDPGTGAVEELQRIDTPAILDAKWSPHLDSSSRPCLGVADAKGHLTLYHLSQDRRLQETQSILVDEESTLVLSLDFSHRLHPDTVPQIITSLSSGSLARLQRGETGEYEIVDKWHAHDFEPWCATWDNWDLNTVWSGGDDLKLKRWDIRDTSTPTFVNKRFDAGVTTITSSPHTPHLLAVGSYDESVRIFDARSPIKPLRTIALGGGIWRCRFHPDSARAGDMLVACMHDGFKVARIDPGLVSSVDGVQALDDETGCEVVTRFDGHTSLAYGADWSRLPAGDDGESLVATCSFYDHTMHVWRA